MDKKENQDFEDFTQKAHLQILLLHWITERLAERQSNKDYSINAIEADFHQHCKKFNHNVDFRFDRGDTILMLTYPIFVAGVEAIGRHSRSDDIIQVIQSRLGSYAEVQSCFQIKIDVMEHLKGEQEQSTWTILRRIRNSLSHFRYEYLPYDGTISLSDRHNGKETARFSMPLMTMLDLAYRFGHSCCLAGQSLR